MPEIIQYVPANITELQDEADLMEKLVESGAITEIERNRLLDQFRAEHQADRESRDRRAQFTNADQREEGESMNAKEIVAQIEQAHSVMSAQVRKLNEVSPTTFSLPTTEEGGASSLTDLLHATIAGNITNASDSLRAIASVETVMCASGSKPAVTEQSTTPGCPQIIQAEAGEVV